MIKTILSSDGIQIHYDLSDHFTPEKCLVLLHGLGGDLTAFNPMRKLLAEKGYSTVAIDLRGQGKSGRPRTMDGYTLDLLADDVTQVITEEKLREIVLIGHCFGGMVALAVTNKIPERIGKLILIDTNYQAPSYARIISYFNFIPRLIFNMVRLLPNFYLKGSVDYSKFAGGADYSPRRIISDILHTSVQSYAFLTNILLNLNLEPLLSSVTTPTLVISGEKDHIYPVKIAKKLHNLLKTSIYKEIKGANHILVISKPKEVSETIEIFLSVGFKS